MLNYLDVRNARSQTLRLYLGDSLSNNGILIENIEGLGPVQAAITSSSNATVDGSSYQSSRRETRNIVLSLSLIPDYVTQDIDDVKAIIYQFFMPKSKITLTFDTTHLGVVTIDGYVETAEEERFTMEPTVSISIMCMDPDFISPTSRVLNKSYTGASGALVVDYKGTTETGYALSFVSTSALDGLTIMHLMPDTTSAQAQIKTVIPANSNITLVTIPGQKQLQMGASMSLLSAIPASYSWPKLQPGSNTMLINLPGGVPGTIMLTYKERFGAI